MKTILIASLVAVSSFFSVTVPSQAETVTVTTTQRVMPVRDEYRPRHRDEYRPRHHRPRDCFVKKVRTKHHGRVVIRETRVCR